MTDRTIAFYARNNTKLLLLIRPGAVFDKNYTGQ